MQRLKTTHFDVVPVQVSQVGIIVFYAFNCIFNVGGVGFLWRIDFGGRSLCNAVPSEANGLALVQQRRMVLILVHHLVEAEDGGQVDDLFLRGVGERLLVLVAQIDGDLFFGGLHAHVLRGRDPLLASGQTGDVRLQVGNIWRFDSLLVDVIDELFAVEGPSR